jgi:hypothetical protein
LFLLKFLFILKKQYHKNGKTDLPTNSDRKITINY